MLEAFALLECYAAKISNCLPAVQDNGFGWVKLHDPTALLRAPGTQWNMCWVGWRSQSEIINACGASNHDSSVLQPVVAGETSPPPKRAADDTAEIQT
jgi:hypothetical protein